MARSFPARSKTRRGWPRGYIKCMALVESHPIAYQMEEFIYHLRDHIVGLNLGRWDYMASSDPLQPRRSGVGPARSKHDPARRAVLSKPARAAGRDLPQARHPRDWRHDGALSQPHRSRIERTGAACARRGQKERSQLFDGWRLDRPSGPERDRGEAVSVSEPGQRSQTSSASASGSATQLRKASEESLTNGTRAAIRTVIRYRNGVLNGKGASLLDGYMEDLATDRIYRLMIAQRMRHREHLEMEEARDQVRHTPETISQMFDRGTRSRILS